MYMDTKIALMKNTNLFVVVIIIIFLFMITNCNRCYDWGNIYPQGPFLVADSLELTNDTISTTDTLWLGASFSDTLIRWDSAKVQYVNYEITLNYFINRLDGGEIYEPYSVIISGNYFPGISNGHIAAGVLLDNNNHTYKYRIGYIFNKPGKYMIEFLGGYGNKPNGCKTDAIELTSYLKVINRNLHLIPKELSPSININTSAAFVVK